MDKKTITTIVIVAIIFAGGGFYGGMKYAQSKTPANNFARNGAFGQGGFGGQNGQARQRTGGRGGAGFASGQILKMDSNSITVKMADGGSKIVYTPATASIVKSVVASSSDLKVGENVLVNGTAAQDGSITAQNVQIRDNNMPLPGFNPRGQNVPGNPGQNQIQGQPAQNATTGPVPTPGQ